MATFDPGLKPDPRLRKKQHNESNIVDAIDQARYFKEFWPQIEKAVLSRQGADKILKQAEPLAAATLVAKMRSEKEDVAFKASKEILDRTQGKAVERNINIYADISRMSEQEVDAQISVLFQELGSASTPALPPPVQKSRKVKVPNKKPEVEVIVEADATKPGSNDPHA